MQKLLKKVPDIRAQYGDNQLYFTDEMRYGTRTECKRRWTRQGHRPCCRVKIGYDWGYLFLAVSCFSGDLFACYCSHLDSDCFKFFAQEFHKHLQESGIHDKVALIGDKATAHSQKHLPEGMTWMSLPTACPELNPAERVFEELRKILAQRVFDNKEDIEKCLSFWLNDYQQKPNKLIQLTKFKWINT